jgi:hypothetical protein
VYFCKIYCSFGSRFLRPVIVLLPQNGRIVNEAACVTDMHGWDVGSNKKSPSDVMDLVE